MVASRLVRKLRQAAGMTRIQLASLAKISLSTVEKIEGGTVTPSVTTAKSLGRVFDVDWPVFFASPGAKSNKAG